MRGKRFTSDASATDIRDAPDSDPLVLTVVALLHVPFSSFHISYVASDSPPSRVSSFSAYTLSPSVRFTVETWFDTVISCAKSGELASCFHGTATTVLVCGLTTSSTPMMLVEGISFVIAW